MPTFNKTQEKLIKMYMDNQDKFSKDELYILLTNLITYKKDGEKYSQGVINSRITSLNKRLKEQYDSTILSLDSKKIVDNWKTNRKENPIDEKKEEDKLEFSMDEINEIKELYMAPFQDMKKSRELYLNIKNRKDRNVLLTHINNLYATLQINSGIRVNELLQSEFTLNGDGIKYIPSKTGKKKERDFIPLWMSNKEWLEILTKTREIAGKESVAGVNKRYNEYLKFNYNTITKSHDLRKVYFHFTKDTEKNPLGHGDKELKKVYDCMKPKEEEKEKVEEIKEEIKTRNDKKRCEHCMMDVLSKNYSRHVRSKKHLKNTKETPIQVVSMNGGDTSKAIEILRSVGLNVN